MRTFVMSDCETALSIFQEQQENTMLDLFAGSGTVGVVCEELNRNYILIDKEETNIQLIKKRVEEKRKDKKVG